MTVRDTSKEAFGKLAGDPDSDRPGAKARLRDKVFAAVVEIGPVHNLRLLEYLQQKEKQKPKAGCIEWTPSNCWPRVTWLASNGHVKDLGAFRGSWRGKKKTLHFWYVSGQLKDIPGWKKVEAKQPIVAKVKRKQPTSPGLPTGAKQGYFFSCK